MKGSFEFWTTINIGGEEVDACLKGSYAASKGCKETLYEPAECGEIDYFDLVLEATNELGGEVTITDSAKIEELIDWDECAEYVEAQAGEKERDAIDGAADLEMDLKREEAFN